MNADLADHGAEPIDRKRSAWLRVIRVLLRSHVIPRPCMVFVLRIPPRQVGNRRWTPMGPANICAHRRLQTLNYAWSVPSKTFCLRLPEKGYTGLMFLVVSSPNPSSLRRPADPIVSHPHSSTRLVCGSDSSDLFSKV